MTDVAGLLSERLRRHALVVAAREERWQTRIAVPPGFAVTRLPRTAALRNPAGACAAGP